jgi:hypothetical protein
MIGVDGCFLVSSGRLDLGRRCDAEQEKRSVTATSCQAGGFHDSCSTTPVYNGEGQASGNQVIQAPKQFQNPPFFRFRKGRRGATQNDERFSPEPKILD